jgi:hypothetical protein
VEKGGSPPGLEAQTYRQVRPHDAMVPPGRDWRPDFEKELLAKW